MHRSGSSLVAGVALGAAALLALLGGRTAASSGAPHQEAAARIRIGVYDSRAVAVGSRDTFLKQQVDDLLEQRKKAEAAGDKGKVETLNARGQNLQKLRHLQAFSNGPVDDIMASIADQLPALAKSANVLAITPRTDFHAADVELVDVTDLLVKAFHPDEKTLKIVADLKNNKPLDIVDVIALKD